MNSSATPPRSVLSVPAGDEHKLVKALGSAADELILDLEDAVPPDRKAQALSELVARDWTGVTTPLTVRINAPGTPWCHSELTALAHAGLPFAAVLVPKVESAGDLHFVDRLLTGAEAAAGRRRPLGIHALIENAAGLRRLDAIAEASSRLQRLVIGYADFAASLGRQGATSSWLFVQDSVLSAARSAGLAAVDGPYLGVDDGPEFSAAVDSAVALGFDGKWVIHPRQLPVVNDRFTPSMARVAQAGRVVDVLSQAHAEGRGAAALDGQMVDEAVAVAARRTLAQAARARR